MQSHLLMQHNKSKKRKTYEDLGSKEVIDTLKQVQKTGKSVEILADVLTGSFVGYVLYRVYNNGNKSSGNNKSEDDDSTDVTTILKQLTGPSPSVTVKTKYDLAKALLKKQGFLHTAGKTSPDGMSGYGVLTYKLKPVAKGNEVMSLSRKAVAFVKSWF